MLRMITKNADVLRMSHNAGYLLFNDVDEVTIFVNSNGINETVLRYVMDEIKSNKVMMESIIKTCGGNTSA